MKSGDLRFAVIQDGARRHYAVPLALQRAGMLERVFTDWYASPRSIEQAGAMLASVFKPATGRRMRERYHPDLDARRVVTRPWFVVQSAWARRRFNSDIAFFEWHSEQMGLWVERYGWGESNALLGFVRNISPRLCDVARRERLIVFGDQMIAPYLIQQAEADRQNQRFPNWETYEPLKDGEVIESIERRTWAASHCVLAMSEYVVDSLAACGVPREKIALCPRPTDAAALPMVDRRGRSGPITVGFIGQLSLRKGTPYFFEVARRVGAARAKFVMVGPSAIHAALLEKHRGDVELRGLVSRSDILQQLASFDVLLFPSTCEGSAGAVTEAMLSGLPIVASPNSGSLVRDGVEGYLCAYDDVDAMADRIERLAADPARRDEMGRNARERASSFNLETYAETIRAIGAGLVSSNRVL